MTECERLSKHILELQKDKGELTDKVNELTEELKLTNNECKEMREELKQRIRENQKLCEQIEKMKCCQNCSHLCGLCELGINGCYVCSKWELRR